MAELTESLRRRRSFVEARFESVGLLHTLSAARFQLRLAVSQAISEFAGGEVLSAGSGRSPYQAQLEDYSVSSTTLDISPEHDPDIIGDVQDMRDVPDQRFDTILCTQVLEHVRNPRQAMGEFERVLRPGGVLILTVPHLSMIHEAPNDFFRFTSYGLEELCAASGLEVMGIRPVGGPLSFVGHVISLGWLSLVAAAPFLFWPAWLINYTIFVRGFVFLDRLLPGSGLLPRDYLLVAKRALR